MTTRYPLAPLAQAMGITLHHVGYREPGQPPDGHTELAERLGITRQWAHQLEHRGLTDLAADRAAIRIGKHPADIWTTWFDGAPGDHDWYADDPSLDQLDQGAAA